ncbi:MAG: C45 family peptidase [Actinomycetota bacterium]|nr:C45 family peptidase [Actinomycetota bacterium]
MTAEEQEVSQELLDLGTTLGDEASLGRRQVRLLDLGGDHYEMGYQQGLQMREAIYHYHNALMDFEAFKLEKPAVMPTRLYLTMAARRAAREMWEYISENCPLQRMRMEGMAKGASTDEVVLYLFLAVELMMNASNYRLGACTAAAVRGERSARGEPMIIKNFDYPEFLQPYYATRRCRSAETNSTLDVTMAPLAGCHDGMNEHGLCISYNYAYGTDMPKANIPVSLLVQEALERCSSTSEAVEFLRQGKRSEGALLLLADASGDMATVELSPNFSGVREPGDDLLINSNHYKCREMTAYDIPRNAYYTKDNVRALRGIRVHESSELRYNRAEQLLSEMDLITMKDLLTVFCDHGESGRGNDNTICRHGPYFSTTCSLIMLPASKRLLVTYGHPCESVFTDFADLLQPVRGDEEEGM